MATGPDEIVFFEFRAYVSADKGRMERETGFEPATSTLARLHSTN